MGRLEVKEFNIDKRFRQLTLAASISIYLVIIMGGVLRATASAGACNGWPVCLGAWIPPDGTNALIDYLHRITALLAGGLVTGAAIFAWRFYRRERWLSWPLFLALITLVFQAILGGIIAINSPNSDLGWASAIHLGLSLVILGSILAASVMAFYRSHASRQPTSKTPYQLKFHSSFARLSLGTLGAIFLLLVSGALLSVSDGGQTCASWPLCTQGLFTVDLNTWTNLAHRLVVLLAGVLISALLIQAWRTQRSQTTVLVAATSAWVLFVAQALLGARLVDGFAVHLLSIHQGVSAAVWAVLVVEVVAVGLSGRTSEEEQNEASPILGRKGLLKDLLLLTKPIVVALLLVTTYAGMVIGAQSFPPLPLAFWTLLGGFMAAGGSGAINQYIDRYDDLKMQRTQRRPIPSGRLTASEGLAFGTALALASFFIMVAFVNLLAALLSLAGIIYYVLIYSIFLKKTTVQNIVIGGGAGAIPPLVGWAAATGGLNIPSLFLFAIIFMWTPPHFWALALVRRKDYARAGVPMLPVVRGEKETRWQILLYTLELVALTLLLPLFGLGGGVYLVGAATLGAWLLMAAYRVWRSGGNRLAWKMYRYSSMYLAFLFMVLMVDRLL